MADDMQPQTAPEEPEEKTDWSKEPGSDDMLSDEAKEKIAEADKEDE